ncbi:membrane-associated transporter [Brachionus plicatilis]|uniref:Membrane-associated transporter n=1 Tax=Brachionus plicatilis TaxID=10195 RepID=A0A3M7SIA4_BRAPC|nr:membrane-associated transporter [Brachionus plicatilis]
MLVLKDERPSRTKLELLKMGAVYFGIELVFSLEIALTVPILLESNVSHNIYSYVYFLSPIFGFVFQPILGAWSDRCQSKYGRRRPFIFALGIASYIGISLILKGRHFGMWLGDDFSRIPIYGIALTAIGVTVLDFSADTCDSPLRAYLLDSCNSRDQHMALNLHAFLGGVGGSLGYILSAIEWKHSFLSILGDESQILFVLMSIIFIFCLYLTLTAAREEPFEIESTYEIVDGDFFGSKETEEKNDSFVKNLTKSFFNMPTELRRLFICQTIGWLAFYSTTLFFTDYIAQNIYHGDPSADRDSTDFMMYEYGIKMGSWCLLTYSISSAVSAIVVEKFLMEKYTPKTLFLFTFFFYIFCCVTIFYLNSMVTILPFCSCFGFMLTTLTTIPYQLLYEFHNDKQFVLCSGGLPGSKRGFGIDCAILGSCHFLSQTIVSSFMSFLTSTVVNDWNSLPVDVVEARSLNCFKSKLDKWLFENREVSATAQ